MRKPTSDYNQVLAVLLWGYGPLVKSDRTFGRTRTIVFHHAPTNDEKKAVTDAVRAYGGRASYEGSTLSVSPRPDRKKRTARRGTVDDLPVFEDQYNASDHRYQTDASYTAPHPAIPVRGRSIDNSNNPLTPDWQD